jgi:predicted amidohydrolase
MKTNLHTTYRHSLRRALQGSFLLATVLVTQGADRAELRPVRNQGNLELSWDDLNAKLQEALTLKGPWQTVDIAGPNYWRTNITGAQRFYRLVMPATGKKWLTVAAVAMNAKTNVEANLQTMHAYMDQALTNGADLVVFPEVALQSCPPWGYSSHTPTSQEMDYVRQTAETVPGPSTSNLVAKASELNLYVVFGLTETDEAGHLYNTSVLLGPQRILGKHRKYHLWDASYGGDEALIWQLGPAVPAVIESPLGKVGLMICIEQGLDEDLRLVNAGADFLVSGSLWFTAAEGSWDQYTIGDASRTKRWYVATDQVGQVGYLTTIGRSRVVDPLGRIVCDTGAKEGMVVCSMDLIIDANR